MKIAAAALLLTFITAATAGFITYNFLSSFTAKVKTAFPTQMVELVSKSMNSTCITVKLRNVAHTSIWVMKIYVNGKEVESAGGFSINPDAVKTIHLHGEYSKNVTYDVKIVLSLGSPLTFNVKY